VALIPGATTWRHRPGIVLIRGFSTSSADTNDPDLVVRIDRAMGGKDFLDR
jgi:hypothetical protein